MRLTPAEAHLICLALVVVDMLGRTLRLQYLVHGCGHRLGFRDSLMSNLFAEAGATLTPLRVGGEPARLAGMLASGVPATASFVAIAFEVITAWPAMIVVAVWVFGRYAPEWWSNAGMHVGATLREQWPWAIAVVRLSAVAWWFGRRLARVAPHRLQRPMRRIMVYWRRMPWWPLAASFAFSILNVLTRLALLPVLALSLPTAPSLPTLLVGSFVLIYGQMILPTPAGAGAVELGFFAGAAGDLGGGGSWLLLMWRVYSSGLGTAAGVAWAVRAYGWPALRRFGARILGAPAGPS
ncbi:MAG: YbhN family protein [Gemmatimonadales bacterium]